MSKSFHWKNQFFGHILPLLGPFVTSLMFVPLLLQIPEHQKLLPLPYLFAHLFAALTLGLSIVMSPIQKISPDEKKILQAFKAQKIDLIALVPFSLLTLIDALPSSLTPLFFLLDTGKVYRFATLFLQVRGLRHKGQTGHLTHLLAQFMVSLLFVHVLCCLWIHIGPTNYSEDLWTQYNKSFYWCVTTLTTIGYGDITPQTNGARLFTIGVMILGVGLYGLVIGSVSRMMSEMDRHREVARQKIQDLQTFMGRYDIPTDLEHQTFLFYNHLLEDRPSADDEFLLAKLPKTLQEELRIYMKMKLIRPVPIFQGCERECLKVIALGLEHKDFSPGQDIVKSGERGHEMFIVGHGRLEVLDDDGRSLASLREGDCFGERSLLVEDVRSNTVRAQDYCVIYSLQQENFHQLIERFPKLKENLFELMSERRAS